MREILHAELLTGGVDPVASGDGRQRDDVRGTMETEYAAALREHAPLAILCVAVDGLERAASAAGVGAGTVVAAVAAAMLALPREVDLLALEEGSQILVLLPRASPKAAGSLARGLGASVKRLSVPGLASPMSARVCVGLAFAQFDAGYWLETLLAVARDGAEVAASSGGPAVHTELYAFHQKRLERLHPERPKPVVPPPPAARVDVAEKGWLVPQGSATPAKGSGPARPAATPIQSPPSLHELERRVLSLAREWTEETLAKALAEQQKSHSSQVERLERRINKLAGALENAQAELERTHAGAPIDPGVASVYRTVQGLRGEHDVAAKQDMLAKLVEMNLAMRAQFTDQG